MIAISLYIADLFDELMIANNAFPSYSDNENEKKKSIV
jgi:hypothetical protein